MCRAELFDKPSSCRSSAVNEFWKICTIAGALSALTWGAFNFGVYPLSKAEKAFLPDVRSPDRQSGAGVNESGSCVALRPDLRLSQR